MRQVAADLADQLHQHGQIDPGQTLYTRMLQRPGTDEILMVGGPTPESLAAILPMTESARAAMEEVGTPGRMAEWVRRRRWITMARGIGTIQPAARELHHG
jgi:hypothetical protein